MLNNESIKAIIYRNIQLTPVGDYLDDMLFGCMLFTHIKNTLSVNSNASQSATTMVNNYRESILSRFNTIKTTYLSYTNARRILLLNKYNKLTDINTNIIENISSILNSKSGRKQSYNPLIFSPEMYGVEKVDNRQYNYLEYVHKNVVNTLYYYYKQMLDISPNDIIIVSANEAIYNPGKILYMKINNVSVNRILTDLENKYIQLPYNSISVDNDIIRIVT